MKKIIYSLSVCLIQLFASAQISPNWINYAAPANYANYDVKEMCTGVDSLGNIYTAASMQDTVTNDYQAVIVKYNSAGTQLWKNTFLPTGQNAIANVVSLLVDKFGNSYVCGYAIHDNANGKDFMVVKYNKNGVLLWTQYWDGGQNIDDVTTAAIFDKSGNVVLTGAVNKFGTNGFDIGVVKWTLAGTQSWTYVYNNSPSNGEDYPYDLASDLSNNLFICGSTYMGSDRNQLLIKLNSSGVNQWTKIKTNTSNDDERASSVSTDILGNVYVTGTTTEWETTKYDASGSVIWSNKFNIGANSLNRYNDKKIKIDKFGSVIVAGDAFYTGSVFTNVVVFKLNPVTGSQTWSYNQNIGGADIFSDFVLDTNGLAYVCGHFDGPLGSDIFTSVVLPNGQLTWSNKYSNTLLAAGGDRPCQIVIDQNNNIIMAGTAETRGSSSQDLVDIFTLRYSALVTGIATLSTVKAEIRAYPNPCHGDVQISIDTKSDEAYSVQVFSANGQLINETIIETTNKTCQLSGLSSGLYLVKVRNSKDQGSIKLIVE